MDEKKIRSIIILLVQFLFYYISVTHHTTTFQSNLTFNKLIIGNIKKIL